MVCLLKAAHIRDALLEKDLKPVSRKKVEMAAQLEAYLASLAPVAEASEEEADSPY